MDNTKTLNLDNSKLLRLLACFSPAELNEFGDFVKSPYFNKSEKLVKLYDFLRTQSMNESCTKLELFELMYPGEPYNDQKLRNRLTLMLKLAENYFAHLEFRQRNFEKNICLVSQLSRKGLDDIFEAELESMISDVEKSKVKSEEYYLRKFIIEKLRSEHLQSKTHSGKSKQVYKNIMLETDNLMNFSMIKLLRTYLKLRNAEGIVKFPHQLKAYEKFIESQYGCCKHILVIEILYKVFLFSKSPDDEKFAEVKNLLKDEPAALKKEDYEIIYTELYDYCKAKQAKGSKEHGREAFELMKYMLAENLAYERDGFLHPHNYVNFAATAVRIGELDWAEAFINGYKDRLRDELRANAFNYNHAVLHYMRGNPEIALDYLSRVKREDFYYYFRIRNLELQILYELGNTEQVRHAIDSYKKVLCSNADIPEDLKARYGNFINYLWRLIVLRDHPDDFELSKLKKEIVGHEDAPFKSWLLEKSNLINNQK